ncbi:hypothetical protein [Streptomyces sp. NBC_00212]|uniref:hypothetical protein n=1 Tax=Streptomyces sp. NBC_00212 TaxID=2975684 RepID=UPI002F90C741
MTGRIIRQFETGYQRTLITADTEGNHLWRRFPGRNRTSPLHGPSPAVSRVLTGLSHGQVHAVLANEESDGGVSYTVPGSVSVAGLALSTPTGSDLDRLATLLTATGGLLRRIQSAGPAATTAAVPSGPARALAWMRNGSGPRATAPLHEELRRSLGAKRWDEAMHWCHEFTSPAPDDSLLHGAASMGQIVLAPQPDAAALLVGEDVARGPADFDAGWLLGELLELHVLAAAQSFRREFLGVARAAFLDGLGRLDDPARTGRAAILRLLVHAHDFAAYVGWHPELLVHARVLPALVDTGGNGILTDPW